MIKKLLMVLGLALLPKMAMAQTATYSVGIDSVTYCQVSVSTYAATRLDNFNGGCEGLMNSRDELKVINSTANVTINLGFSTAVSTLTANSHYGEELLQAGIKTYSLPGRIGLYGMSQAGNSTGAQKVTVIQIRHTKAYNQ